MLQFLLPLAILIGGICAIFSADSKLPAQPDLDRAFWQSKAYNRLSELAISDTVLRCSWSGTKKVITGHFTFDELDGRTAITVTGPTPCADTGALVRIENRLFLTAKENYSLAVVEKEIDALLTAAQIQPAVENEDNQAAVTLLSTKFRERIVEKDFVKVTFTCKRAGDVYAYYETSHSGRYRRTAEPPLTTRCAKAHENFIVVKGAPFRYGVTDTFQEGLVRVTDYNNVPLSSIEAAFSEYLKKPPVAATF